MLDRADKTRRIAPDNRLTKTFTLKLTDRERRVLKRLIYRVIEGCEADRRGGLDEYRGEAEKIYANERDARAFLRRLE